MYFLFNEANQVTDIPKAIDIIKPLMLSTSILIHQLQLVTGFLNIPMIFF